MKNGTKTFLTWILAIFFCPLFIIGLVSAFLYSSAFDSEKYIAKIEENDYEAIILETVHKQLDDMGDVITLDTDDVYDLIDKNDVVKYSKNYTKKYLEAIFENKSFDSETVEDYSIEYAKKDLRVLVEIFYTNNEQSFSEEEFEIIYDYVEKQINSSLRFLSKSILDKTLPFGKYMVVAKDILGYLRFFLIPSALFLIGILLVNLKSGIGKILCRTAAAVYIPSALMFIPSFLFANYDLGEKLILGRSPLSAIVNGILDNLVNGFSLTSGIIFWTSAAVIVAGAVLSSITPVIPEENSEQVAE